MDISELLQEARPLYIQRKKRKEFVKKCTFILTPILICVMAIMPFVVNTGEDSYYTSSTSIVEQMGFPTDDYGLLKVD